MADTISIMQFLKEQLYNMSCVVRFAPSPTGFMHVGNARIAIINYLFARKNEGQFIFRIDDTDVLRSKKEYEDAIKNDMNWLGITKIDRFFRQSERMARYEEIKNILISKGLLYKCYESPEELEFKRKMALSKGKAPVYDRESLKLSSDDMKKLEDSGIKPYWRFKLPDETIVWNDMIMGEISYDLKNVSDPVVVKADGTYLYTFSSVIDDFDSGITHIIRGQDHTTNTAVQIAIFNAISNHQFNVNFAHLSLLVNKDGSQFSKRLGSLNLGDLREKGIEGMAINSLLATLGSSLDTIPLTNIEDLIDYFDISKFSTNSPKFDIDELYTISRKIVHKYSYDQVKSRIRNGDVLRRDVFDLVHENVEKIDDFYDWINVLSGEWDGALSMSEDDKIFIKNVINFVECEDILFDKEGLSKFLEILKTKFNKNGKSLYMPIRNAISGMEHGPNIIDMIIVLGRDEFIRRLKNSIR